MSSGRRRQRFVDREVQGAVLLRVLIYWSAWIGTSALAAAILSLLGCLPTIDGAGHLDFWRYLAPAGLAAVVLLPVALLDASALSNKLVGSLLRLRRDLRHLAAGHEVAPLRGRNDDFWQDCGYEFNALRARVAELENELEACHAAEKSPASRL